MLNVYMESTSHSELVAIFETEELYMACLPVLEKYAKEHRMIVTEAVMDTTLKELTCKH